MENIQSFNENKQCQNCCNYIYFALGYPPPECKTGKWTEFFNDGNPQRGSDFEGFGAKIRRYSTSRLCRNPTNIDIRLTNGADYRTAGQVVNFSPKFGFECVNSRQPNGTRCLDYMVRFCCPTPPAPGIYQLLINKLYQTLKFMMIFFIL